MLTRQGALGAPAAARRAGSMLPARLAAPMRRGPKPAGASRGAAAFAPAPGPLRRAGGRARTVKAAAFFQNIFKQDASENTRKKFQDRVDAINALEPAMQALSDEGLRAKTDEFKARVARGESLDSLLPEAFAVSALRARASPLAARAAVRPHACAAAAQRLRPGRHPMQGDARRQWPWGG